MMTNWRLNEGFLRSANRLRKIFFPNIPDNNLNSIEEVRKAAEGDELFNYILFLLSQEYSCLKNEDNCEIEGYNTVVYNTNGWNNDSKLLTHFDQSDNFNSTPLSIKTWFKKVLSGLLIEPFPTVEYLLRRQGRPSIYADFEEIFPATRFLNRLAQAFNLNENDRIIFELEGGEIIIYERLVDDLKEMIEPIFWIKAKGPIADYAEGPSFRFELLEGIGFDSRTEFAKIPVELLSVEEGCDFGVPFGKRWARRSVARAVAHDKIFFDSLRMGSFPEPQPRSLETACMNFSVQLPENVGIDLIHENVFDEAMLSADFMDYASFSMHFAQFLEKVPRMMLKSGNTGIRNTEIFAHAPLGRLGRNGSKGSLASFRALLLACGLRGHLNLTSLPPVDIHEILNFDSENTSACLLIGLAASHTIKTAYYASSSKNNHKFLIKLFTMHLPSYQTSLNLEIPPTLQLASTLALGLYRFRTFDRGISQMLLKEIFRKVPENVNFKANQDSPLYAIIPPLALGMCLMGAKEENNAKANSNQNHGAFADDILMQLNAQNHSIIPVLIATALININSKTGTGGGSPIKLPYARNLPDLLDKPEGVVFWCHLAGRMEACWLQADPESISDQGPDAIKLDFDAIFEAACRPESDSVWTDSSLLCLFVYACQVLSANSAFLALKYAGTCKAISSIDAWLDKISAAYHPILHNTDGDYFFVKIQSHLLTTLQYLLLCKCIINSGSGQVDCWARLRGQLASHPLLLKYGNGKLFYSALGFLFIGRGRGVDIKTVNPDGSLNHLAVVSLLCSLLPIIPTSPVDPEFAFAPLLDTLWPLACK